MSKKRAKEDLLEWFFKNKRDFPWRKDKSPYAVWVSEIMLQQTRASVVVQYFPKFMQRFPTLEALASACLDDVIKAWEGLGYYKRARYLHKGAQFVMQEFQGQVPTSLEKLRLIPGIGSYTAGAIRSFAFGRPSPAIDGNVLRVMARFLLIEDMITSAKAQKKVHEGVQDLLKGENSANAMEAIIELGALVCTKTPDCSRCPLQSECRALQKGYENKLPVKGKILPTIVLHRYVALFSYESKFLVYQEKGPGLMKDLWQFPYIDMEKSLKDGESKLLEYLKIQGQKVHEFTLQEQSFTRYRAKLYPVLWQVREMITHKEHQWKTLEELVKLPFCSGHRKIVKLLLTS